MRQDEAAIGLRVDSIARLFDPFDPFPIPSRDLARAAEDFIVGWARELPSDARLAIIVHAPESEARSPEAAALKEAIASHFTARARSTAGDLQELLRIGRVSLAIGLTVLALCVALGRLAVGALGDGPIARFLSEGLIILGWVANWRPIQIFLYEWWPVARRIRLYRRLADARVEVRAASMQAP